MLEKAQETKNINVRVPDMLATGRSIKIIHTNRTSIPFTMPLTVPPMI